VGSAPTRRRWLESHGPNRLAGGKKESGFQAFLRQYRDFMQNILLAAAAISLFVTGDVGTAGMLAGLTVSTPWSGCARVVAARPSRRTPGTARGPQRGRAARAPPPAEQPLRPEIGNELHLSLHTVKTHMRYIYAKLGVHRRTEAVDRARELGLLAPSSRRR
jgi:Bacterial regulatory proteins, luxR family/Cation transporter/ATPase, N-terminus